MLFDTHSSVEHLAMMEVRNQIQIDRQCLAFPEGAGTSSCQDGGALKVEVLLKGGNSRISCSSLNLLSPALKLSKLFLPGKTEVG